MAFDLPAFFLCLINFMQNASVSMVAPFLPLEVKKKEINTMFSGFLLGTFALVYTISSWVTGKYLVKIGRTRAVMIGVFLLVG